MASGQREFTLSWTLDRLEYTKQTGKDAGSGMYYRLKDAINANKSAEIKAIPKE